MIRIFQRSFSIIIIKFRLKVYTIPRGRAEAVFLGAMSRTFFYRVPKIVFIRGIRRERFPR